MSSGQRSSPTFGTRLRRLRERAGLTQEELAAGAGLTAKAVGALERGERKRPYPQTVRTLAQALGLSDDERADLVGSVPKRVEAAPAPKTAEERAGDVPAPLDPILGRERELGEVGGVLRGRETRLLTLTGPGGVGKTRLAVEVARREGGAFADGAAFVDLAPLGDAGLVVSTVARTLGLRETGAQPAREALRLHLDGKEMLLVLDNLEHVVEATPEISDLLAACPGLFVLATSRASLRSRWEHEYPVQPLEVPRQADPAELEGVAGSPAGRLFAERAREARPAFEVTAENAGSVAEICRRLDGLPLAIELAAARTRLLDPRDLLPRLDRALSAGGAARDLPERQRTMRGAIGWSHDLLGAPEQSLFRRLSMFAGGWTLEAAEAVGAGKDLEAEEVIEPLGGLVEQSLVAVKPGAETRYRMLEPVRQYALERLDESGESEAVRRRHAEYYLQVAERADAEMSGPQYPGWLDELESEHDNLRVALAWALGQREAGVGLRIAGALRIFWQTRGYLGEGRGWLERFLELEAGAEVRAARAKALVGVGWISTFEGDYALAKRRLDESVALYRDLEDPEGLASALTHLGFVATLGQYPGIPVGEVLEEALALKPLLEDRRNIANLTIFSGLVVAASGDVAAAIPPHEEALALFREVGDEWGMKVCLTNLGLLSLSLGDLERASKQLQENLQLSRDTDDKLPMQYSLLGLAAVAALRGDLARAARMWGSAEAMREKAGIELPPLARVSLGYDAMVAAMREKAGGEEFDAAWTEGRSLSQEEAVGYAFAAGEA